MNRDSTLEALEQKIEEKKRKKLQEIMTIETKELKSYAKSLQSVLLSEVNTIENDTKSKIKTIQKTLEKEISNTQEIIGTLTSTITQTKTNLKRELEGIEREVEEKQKLINKSMWLAFIAPITILVLITVASWGYLAYTKGKIEKRAIMVELDKALVGWEQNKNIILLGTEKKPTVSQQEDGLWVISIPKKEN